MVKITKQAKLILGAIISMVVVTYLIFRNPSSPQCTVWTDCKAGYECVGGKCVQATCGATGATGATCPTGSKCSGGDCVPIGCSPTNKCPAGMHCDPQGKCQTVSPTGSKWIFIADDNGNSYCQQSKNGTYASEKECMISECKLDPRDSSKIKCCMGGYRFCAVDMKCYQDSFNKYNTYDNDFCGGMFSCSAGSNTKCGPAWMSKCSGMAGSSCAGYCTQVGSGNVDPTSIVRPHCQGGKANNKWLSYDGKRSNEWNLGVTTGSKDSQPFTARMVQNSDGCILPVKCSTSGDCPVTGYTCVGGICIPLK